MQPISFRSVVDEHALRLFEFINTSGVDAGDRDLSMLREAARVTDLADEIIGGCWRICEKTPDPSPMHTKYPRPIISGKLLMDRELPLARPEYHRDPEYTVHQRRFDAEVGALLENFNGSFYRLGEFELAYGGNTYFSTAPSKGLIVYGDKLAVQIFTDRIPSRAQGLMAGAYADDLFGQAAIGADPTPGLS